MVRGRGENVDDGEGEGTMVVVCNRIHSMLRYIRQLNCCAPVGFTMLAVLMCTHTGANAASLDACTVYMHIDFTPMPYTNTPLSSPATDERGTLCILPERKQ